MKELKKEVFNANTELYKKNLAIFTFGNVSGIDRQRGIIAIKPTGVDYLKLNPDDIVLIDLNGLEIDGTLKPSSDTKTHLKLYNCFLDIGAVVHTHSRHATAYAQAKIPIECLGTTHADYFKGYVPCTEVIKDSQINKDYEEETGNLIIQTFKNRGLDYHSVKACLVASHGPFIWGDTTSEAVFLAQILEEISLISLYSRLINPKLKGIKKTLLDKHYLRKHGNKAYYGQN